MSWPQNILDKFTSSDKTETTANSTSKETSDDQLAPTPTQPSSEKTGHLENNAKIQTLIPLRNLESETFSYLPHKFLSYPAESTVFIKDQPSDYLYYLWQGSIALKNEGHDDILIDDKNVRSNFPLSSGELYGTTATTLSNTLILTVSKNVPQLIAEQQDIENFDIDINLPKNLKQQAFFKDFIHNYQENTLTLPSLPDIALKLRQAMKNEIGVDSAVKIIQLDPAMTAKLIQIANSPLYSPINPITNCQDAVSRLGLSTTRNLVMSLGLKQLFKCQDAKISAAMHKVWKRSLYISSLSTILAEEVGSINPDDALLAGLLCDIGIVPLLSFAADYQGEQPSLTDIKQAIPYFRAPLGQLLLTQLGFAEELTQMPFQSENWYYQHEDSQLNLIEIVILAKLHSYFGLKEADNLPCINTIPAYSKLPDNQLSSDLSLSILRQANKRIKMLMAELS